MLRGLLQIQRGKRRDERQNISEITNPVFYQIEILNGNLRLDGFVITVKSKGKQQFWILKFWNATIHCRFLSRELITGTLNDNLLWLQFTGRKICIMQKKANIS